VREVALNRTVIIVLMDPAAEVSRSRPFYSQYADAYDLLATDSVEPWVNAVSLGLPSWRPWCSSSMRAAGQVDTRPGLLLVAIRSRWLTRHRTCSLSLDAGVLRPPARLVDLRAMPAPALYDVITCRGVLNDLIIDADREAALQAMARALRPGGFLFCDVREAGASAARADGTSFSKQVTMPEGGELTFTSTSSWSARLLLVREEHVLVSETVEQRSEYQFAMRPWTKEEITDRFIRVGLIQVTSEPGVGRSAPDRLFVHARRG
jgi:hypothetical protein